MENILAAGRQRRLVNGLILTAAAAAVYAGLIVFSAGPAWFLIVFLLAWLAAMMLLQARDRT
jgi:hypothetical protein